MRIFYTMFFFWLVLGSAFAAKPEEIPYQYLQYITTPLDQGAVYQFVVPPEIFDGCEAFPHDLQVMGAGGSSWPYKVHAPVPEHNLTALPGKEMSSGGRTNETGGAFIELQVFRSQLSRRGLEHNQVTVRTAGTVFKRRVLVFQRYKAEQPWRPLGAGWIMQFGEGTDAGLRRISYAPSRAPYLRVEVLPDEKQPQDAVTLSKVSAGFADHDDRNTEWVPLPSVSWTPWQAVAERPGWNQIELDFGFRSVPVERLAFDVEDTSFSRALTISGRNSISNSWRKVGSDAIYRLGDQAQTEINLSHCTYRWLKLEFLDGEAPSLKINNLRAYAVPRTVFFEAFGSEKGLLRYGSSQQRDANPGTSKRLARSDPTAFIPVALGNRIAVSTFAERKKLVRPWAFALGSLLVGTVVLLILMRRMLL